MSIARLVLKTWHKAKPLDSLQENQPRGIHLRENPLLDKLLDQLLDQRKEMG